MQHRKLLKLEEACQETGINQDLFLEFIRRSWIVPIHERGERGEAWELDEEDIARTRLILELRFDFGANDEAIPIILHLLDEVYAIRAKLQGLV